MKKLLSLCFAITVLSGIRAMGDADAPIVAASSCDIGTMQVTAPANCKNFIVPVKYKSFVSGGNIPVAEMVKVSGLSAGDILIRINGTKYEGWALNDDYTWVPGINVNLLGHYTAGTATAASSAASETQFAIGNALWLIRQSYTSATTIQLFGKYVELNTLTTDIVANMPNLCANPKNEVVYLATALSTVAPADGDQILLIGNNGPGAPYTWSEAKSRWYCQTKRRSITATTTLAAHQGFWYVSKGGEGSITW